jgi:dihydrofolate reductase
LSRIAAFITITVDGYYEGPDEAFDFWTIDDDFNAFSLTQLDAASQLVFGRRTYAGMATYWQSDDAVVAAPEIAHRMNTKPKIVASQTLERASWNPTTILRDPTELAALKTTGTAELLVLGSPNLTASLAQTGLLDELRIMICPVAIGAGQSLFKDITRHLPLRLFRTQAFASGNLLVTYTPTPRGPEPSEAG